MNNIIDKIIDKCLRNKNLNRQKEDVDFYERCRNEHKEYEKQGADYSQCKNFSDLAKVTNEFFLKKIIESE